MTTLHSMPCGPTWDCTGCGEPWPCLPRRLELLAEYKDPRDRVALHLYLASAFVIACESAEIRALPAGVVYGRFMGWAR